MNAIQFIKEHGVEKAREVVSGAPDETVTHFDLTIDGLFYFKFEKFDWFCFYDKHFVKVYMEDYESYHLTNLKEIKSLIDQIINDKKNTTKRYELLNNLIDYCIPYTIYRPLNSKGYIDTKSCIDGEAIHRARCKYDFDEETHKGIGLVINEIDDNELNDKYI